MPVNRAILEADLKLLRGLVRQMSAEGDGVGVVAAITDVAGLIADRSGVDRAHVERRLYELMQEEGLLPHSAEGSAHCGVT